MKARIINSTTWGGNHQQIWLNNNQNIVFAGQLVSEWNLTDICPNSEFVKPEWNGKQWIEAITNNELSEIRRPLIEQIDERYTEMISKLFRKPMEKIAIGEMTEIPQIIKDERDKLRYECNQKISELGVDVNIYRKSKKEIIILINK